MISWHKKKRRQKLLQRPWPDAWSTIVLDLVHQARRLNQPMFRRLCESVQVILGEKNWEAHGGLKMTDEIKLTIAARASLMLLGVDDFYFDNVKTILVFPDTLRRTSNNGWLVNEDQYHAGEAWQGGPIVLSWHDVLDSGVQPSSGRNLVIHEFAHSLDGIDGQMGGDLFFQSATEAQQWQVVSEREFNHLHEASQMGLPTLLDPYGASSKAEFFAVAVETFFELPLEMQRQHSELFQSLVHYFRIDPATWTLAK